MDPVVELPYNALCATAWRQAQEMNTACYPRLAPRHPARAEAQLTLAASHSVPHAMHLPSRGCLVAMGSCCTVAQNPTQRIRHFLVRMRGGTPFVTRMHHLSPLPCTIAPRSPGSSATDSILCQELRRTTLLPLPLLLLSPPMHPARPAVCPGTAVPPPAPPNPRAALPSDSAPTSDTLLTIAPVTALAPSPTWAAVGTLAAVAVAEREPTGTKAPAVDSRLVLTCRPLCCWCSPTAAPSPSSPPPFHPSARGPEPAWKAQKALRLDGSSDRTALLLADDPGKATARSS